VVTKEGKVKFVHEPNFIGVNVTCTECIKSGKTTLPLEKECKICGKHRTISFAPFEFHETKFDKKFTTSISICPLPPA
jgi:hypothetical protein